MATLYFNGAVGNEWTELGNWWTNDSFTTQATSLPTAADSVIASASIIDNSGDPAVVVNFTLNDPYNDFWQSLISLTVTEMATFNGSSSNGGTVTGNATFNGSASNSDLVSGDATFNDGSYNGATVTGNATFNGSSSNGGTVSGNATFNDSSYNSEGTVTGNATFNDSSYNQGEVGGHGTFTLGAFNDETGVVLGGATFNDSSNLGTVYGGAVFNNSFADAYSYVSGNVTFNGTSDSYAYDDGTNTYSASLGVDEYLSANANPDATVTLNDTSYAAVGTYLCSGDGSSRYARGGIYCNAVLNGSAWLASFVPAGCTLTCESEATAANQIRQVYDYLAYNSMIPYIWPESVTINVKRGINGSSILGVI